MERKCLYSASFLYGKKSLYYVKGVSLLSVGGNGVWGLDPPHTLITLPDRQDNAKSKIERTVKIWNAIKTKYVHLI